MAKGFELQLRDYCSHCGDFEPEAEKMEITCYGDAVERYLTVIRCENIYKCARIAENLKMGG